MKRKTQTNINSVCIVFLALMQILSTVTNREVTHSIIEAISPSKKISLRYEDRNVDKWTSTGINRPMLSRDSIYLVEVLKAERNDYRLFGNPLIPDRFEFPDTTDDFTIGAGLIWTDCGECKITVTDADTLQYKNESGAINTIIAPPEYIDSLKQTPGYYDTDCYRMYIEEVPPSRSTHFYRLPADSAELPVKIFWEKPRLF